MDLSKNVLSAYFDSSVEQESRVCDSFVREVSKDEKGEEHIKYVPFDSKSYQESLGYVDSWTLESLLSAGIDSRFAISTGFATRLETESMVIAKVNEIESVVESEKA